MLYISELLTSSCFLFFESVSPDADSLHHLFIYFLIAAGFVFFSVTGVIVYILFKYRYRGEDREPPQVHENLKIEVTLTLLSLGLVSFFFYLTISTMVRTTQSPEGHKPDLVITGHQWWWEAEYPGANVTTANEIHIPVGTKLLLQFTSDDVIHDWWVPEFGKKMDVIPDQKNHLWVEVKKPGTYLGACSEYCGEEHAWMRIRVIAQKPAEFKKWEERHAKPADSLSVSADSMATLGKKIFSEKTCGNCHNVKGTQADGIIGPDLTHLQSRKTLLTGKIKNTPENLFRWIKNPQKVKEGAHMPQFILKKKQINALVSYLETLK